jgi:hypothetical protein
MSNAESKLYEAFTGGKTFSYPDKSQENNTRGLTESYIKMNQHQIKAYKINTQSDYCEKCKQSVKVYNPQHKTESLTICFYFREILNGCRCERCFDTFGKPTEENNNEKSE